MTTKEKSELKTPQIEPILDVFPKAGKPNIRTIKSWGGKCVISILYGWYLCQNYDLLFPAFFTQFLTYISSFSYQLFYAI